MINKEMLTIYTTASIRTYLQKAGFGVPVVFMQQGPKSDATNEDEIQFIFAISFPPRGSKNEIYATVHLRAVVRTKIISSDIYRHTRVKARLVELLDKVIPLLRVGGDDSDIYDKTQWGILRKIPSETITVTPTSVDVPDASMVEVFYEVQPC